jgi:hypothetical protein
MRRLVVLLALLAWAPPALAQGHADALASGRFDQAWRALEDEPDLLRRARGRAEVLYRAGDPEGALRAAREGLASAPDDLELLHRATAAALWLADAGGARSWLERLAKAVERNSLAGENRRAWEASVASFRRQSDELAAAEDARAAAVRRARWLALGTLASVAAGLVVLARLG